MYYVYRYMIGNQWVYVGKADSSHVKNELQNRIKAHENDARFENYRNAKIQYCMFQSAGDMNAVETMLIKTQKPILNIVDKTDSDLMPFVFDPNKVAWFDIDLKNKTQRSNKPKRKNTNGGKKPKWRMRIPAKYGGGEAHGHTQEQLIDNLLLKIALYSDKKHGRL